MDIQTIDIKKLNPAQYNPRKDLKSGDTEYEKLKRSIEEFGYVEPILINKDLTVIGGHQRLKILKDLKFKKVDCVVIDVDKNKEKALNVALNKISGEWDQELLKSLMQELKVEDFDLELTGFDFDELNDLLDIEEKEVEEDNFDSDGAYNDIEEATTKRGYIYKLGKHMLMCGDSTDENNIKKLINENDIDMVFTDPPYDMDMGGQGCFKDSTKNIKKRIDNIIHFDPYIISFLPNMDIGTYYICTSKDGIPKYLDIFKEHNFNILIWCKTNPTPFTAGTFLPDIEYIMYFGKKGKKIWNNSLKPTEIYKKYYISSKIEGRNDNNIGSVHPTIKPLKLINNRILISSNENGIVLDLFGGSGSTLIACEQTNRKCYMMELDEKYCDVIIKRYEEYTGNKAELING